jgi:mannose-6-phosphate isomerase-like protein (cupin superfamily)
LLSELNKRKKIMTLFNQLLNVNTEKSVKKSAIVSEIKQLIDESGYTIIELDDKRPWGGYFRLSNKDADRFIGEFFPGLTPEEARCGNDKAELSPKILLVSPGQRLSWQYHNRRSEIWSFLTDGIYNNSLDDKEGPQKVIKAGDGVRFKVCERHRLIGRPDAFGLVAEIWQHADPDNISDEDDIVRLQDDYNR